MSSRFYVVTLPVLPFLHGLSGRIMLNFARHTNLCIHNLERYMFLWVVPLSCYLTLVCQLLVRSRCAFMFIVAFYTRGPSSRSIPEWLGEKNSSTSSISRIGSKQLYSADQSANPTFVLFYLGVLPHYVIIVMRIAPPLMNSWCSDISLHHYSFLGSMLL